MATRTLPQVAPPPVQGDPVKGLDRQPAPSGRSPPPSPSVLLASELHRKATEEPQTPPFNETEVLHEIQTSDGSTIHLKIDCEIARGFFRSSDGAWTCYRRNYFLVNCSYTLRPELESSQPLFLYYSGNGASSLSQKRIQAIAVTISAQVDGTNGKSVGLTSHTVKRDKGPILPIQLIPLWPADRRLEEKNIWPMLPLQGSSSMNAGGKDHCSFERIQFEAATANNGKRRAQQQYYHVRVELQCDIRLNADCAPRWVKIAYRCSTPLVVRGRSPNHYANEGPHNADGPPNGKTREWQDTGTIAPSSPLRSLEEDHEAHYTRSFKRPGKDVQPQPEPTPAVFRVFYGRPHYPIRPRSDVIDTVAQEVLDDSSVSTYRSLMKGSTRPGTRTSVTTVDDVPNLAEQFVKLLLEFDGIRSLLEACFDLDKEDRAHRNIHRLVKRFAVKLRSEGVNPVDLAVARALKHQSRQISGALREMFLPREVSKSLPLDQIPNFRHHTMEQFMAEYPQYDDPPDSLQRLSREDLARRSIPKVSGTDTMSNHVFSEPEAGQADLLNAASTISQPQPKDHINIASKTDHINITAKTETYDNKDSSSDESDANSDLNAFGNREEGADTDLERGREFLSNSEALEDFREDLLDLRVGLENAVHNRSAREMSEKAGAAKGIRAEDDEKALEDGLDKDNREISATSQKSYASLLNVTKIFHRAQRYLRRAMRPSLKPGMRRIEWICECGEELFADFNNDNPWALDLLQTALCHSNTVPNTTAIAADSASQPVGGTVSTNVGTSSGSLGASQQQQPYKAGSTGQAPEPASGRLLSATASTSSVPPRYLAVCVSVGGIYKSLSELDVSQIKSDSQLFLAVASLYRGLRNSRSLWNIFLKPVGVEFIQLSVWDIRKGYISIFDRPTSVPPKDEPHYDFCPRPLTPLPPVPPETFIHYLQHQIDATSDTSVQRLAWTPRLPTRKSKRLVDCDIPTYGWGIYIREGPNRYFVFWMIIVSVVSSVLLSLLWAFLKGDVQGASGLGTLVLGVHSVVMAAFMFKFGEVP